MWKKGTTLLLCMLLLWYCVPAGLITCMVCALLWRDKQTEKKGRALCGENVKKRNIAA